LQNEYPNAVPLVFFDEMNAKKSNQPVFDAFLEPLEDGSYNYDGKTIHLKPCLWIFAGTERPVNPKSHASDKALDFESRLSHEVMYLNGLKRPDSKQASTEEDSAEDPEQLEQIYIGVATIRTVFPDVTKISKHVLRAFNIIDSKKPGLPDSLKGPRGIRRFVNSFEYVQYGRVVKGNLPKAWHKQMAVDERLFREWDKPDHSEEQLVEIKSSI
jgi:hypothetical protein